MIKLAETITFFPPAKAAALAADLSNDGTEWSYVVEDRGERGSVIAIRDEENEFVGYL